MCWSTRAHRKPEEKAASYMCPVHPFADGKRYSLGVMGPLDLQSLSKNKMEPTNPNANTYVDLLCTERDAAGQTPFFHTPAR